MIPGLACRPSTLTYFCRIDTHLCMRTTLDIDDRLLREAKKRAVDGGEPVTRVIERALRAYLHPPRRKRQPFRLRLLTKKGRALSGVDWDDRDSLYDRMEGRS